MTDASTVEEATRGLRDALVQALDHLITAAASEPGSTRVTAMRDELADTYAKELIGAVERGLMRQAAALAAELDLPRVMQ